jgi:hypothetical protein
MSRGARALPRSSPRSRVTRTGLCRARSPRGSTPGRSASSRGSSAWPAGRRASASGSRRVCRSASDSFSRAKRGRSWPRAARAESSGRAGWRRRARRGGQRAPPVRTRAAQATPPSPPSGTRSRARMPSKTRWIPTRRSRAQAAIRWKSSRWRPRKIRSPRKATPRFPGRPRWAAVPIARPGSGARRRSRFARRARRPGSPTSMWLPRAIPASMARGTRSASRRPFSMAITRACCSARSMSQAARI